MISNTMKPLVSIIIPTYNSEKTITKCLESIKNQTYESIETIVVDSYSKDRTVELIKSYDTKVIRGYFNKPRARNVGVLSSSGDYIIMADADFVFEPDLVSEVVKCFKKENCDAIFIPEEYLGDSFLGKCKNLEKKIYHGNEIIEAPRVYKRWVFHKILFDEKTRDPMNTTST